MRKTGIPFLGDVPWGTHFCQFYRTRDDLLDILVPYFREGLQNNEFCMWVTSEPLHADDARRALTAAVPDLDRRIADGQMEILDYSQWYTTGGHFSADRVLQGWVDKETAALARGYGGLRLTGNTFWLEQSHWQDFSDYEAVVDSVLPQRRMLALCTYSLDRCGAFEVVDVVSNHQFALIKRDGRWEIIESTERRKAELALRESEARYHALFQSMSEGFALHEILCDADGKPCDYRFLEINPAFERLTGLRRDALLGRTVNEALPGTEPFWIETYGRVALTGEPAHFEHHSTALGRTFDVSAYRTAPGQFAVLFLDITERRRHAEALRRTAEDLTRSNKDLEQFAYVASHDLQEPLREVAGYLGVLGHRYGEHLDGDALRCINGACGGAKRMQTLIEDLLTYSRVATRGEPQAATDTGAALARAIENLRASIDEAGATITHDALPTLCADGGQLTQLFQNLVANAAKFRGERRPEIHVGARRADGGWVFSVRDNGIGIEPQYRDRIFLIFQRLHNRREYPGTGIGLAICKKIIERHGGRIWVESEAGQGSTFHFTIPDRAAPPA